MTSGQFDPKRKGHIMPKIKVSEQIIRNRYVIELINILRTHNKPSHDDFQTILKQVSEIERQLETAVQELAAMRRDFAEAQRKNNPLKTVMQKAIIIMQNQVLALRENLAELKQNIVTGCKKAVTAFKENGTTALDSITRFFKVKPVFEAIRNGSERSVKLTDKAISNIEAVSMKYHEAGRRIKNAGRSLKGKETIKEIQPNGKISKSFTAPFRAIRKCFKAIKNSAVVAVDKLKHLEEQATKQKKPSIKKTMRDYNKKISKTVKKSSDRDITKSKKSGVSI